MEENKFLYRLVPSQTSINNQSLLFVKTQTAKNTANIMIPKPLLSSLSIALVFFFSSCTTYLIPVESFKQQFAGLDTANMKEVTTRGPMGDKVTYKTYPIDNIHAVDKSGNPVTLSNGPSIEIRFTDTLNRKTIFYFDMMRFDGENIVGRQSRIISSFKKTIPINAVKKIEVQDGRKNYRYVN